MSEELRSQKQQEAQDVASAGIPAVIEAVFPQKQDGESKPEFLKRLYGFVKEIAKGANHFQGAYDRKQIKEFPRLGQRPPLDKKAVRRIPVREFPLDECLDRKIGFGQIVLWTLEFRLTSGLG